MSAFDFEPNVPFVSVCVLCSVHDCSKNERHVVDLRQDGNIECVNRTRSLQ